MPISDCQCFNVFHTGNTTKKPGKKHFEMTWKLPCRESGHVWLAVAFWWLRVFLCVCCRLVLVLMQSAWTVSQQLCRRLWRFFPRPMFSGVLWPERIAMERRRAFHRTTFWKSGERLHLVSWAAEENTFVGDAIWGVPPIFRHPVDASFVESYWVRQEKNRNI